MQVNRLAEALGMDPVELRMRNLIEDDSILCTNTKPPKGVTIKPVLEACATRAGWDNTDTGWNAPAKMGSTDALKRGRGLAVAFKNIGFSFGARKIAMQSELHGKTKVSRLCYITLVQRWVRVHTVSKQFAAEALDVPLEKIDTVYSDTAITGDSGSVSASRMTFMAGNAIKGAADLALEKWAAKNGCNRRLCVFCTSHFTLRTCYRGVLSKYFLWLCIRSG